MNTLKWMKDYPGNKFYPYTHTDAVLVGNDEENLRNLTDELNQINNKITESVSGTQSDWNETDETSPSYIKNKPTSLPADGGNSDTLDGKHANDFINIEEANILIKDLSNDPDSGIITVTRMDNTTFAINIPKTLVFQSALFDEEANEIVITWSDNSQSRIPVDGLINIYTGSISETIQISISEDNTISAIIKEGSINRNLLSPDLQGNIQSAIDHLSHTQGHIPDGGNVGQVVGMTDGGIGWVMPQPSDNTPTKMSQLENDCNYISESVLANALAEKIDKTEGMGLSSNDYSSDQKEKLLHIEDGANKYVHPETHPASMIAEDETHQFVTSEEKALIGTNSLPDISFDETTSKLIIGEKEIDLSSLQKTVTIGKGDEITPGFNENMVWHQNTFQGMNLNYSQCKYMKDKFFILTKTNYWLMGETPENLKLKDIKEIDETLPATVVVSNIFFIDDNFYICSYNSDTDYTFSLHITNDFVNYKKYSGSYLLYGIEGIEKINGKYIIVGKLTKDNKRLVAFPIESWDELSDKVDMSSKYAMFFDNYYTLDKAIVFVVGSNIKVFGDNYYYAINNEGKPNKITSQGNRGIFIIDDRMMILYYTNSMSSNTWYTRRHIAECFSESVKVLYDKEIRSTNGYPNFDFVNNMACANATYIGGKYLFIKNNKGIFVNSLEELLSEEDEGNMFSICSQNIESLCHNYEYILLGTQNRYLFAKIS